MPLVFPLQRRDVLQQASLKVRSMLKLDGKPS